MAATLWAVPLAAAFGLAAGAVEPRGGDLIGAFAAATEDEPTAIGDEPTASWQQDPARFGRGERRPRARARRLRHRPRGEHCAAPPALRRGLGLDPAGAEAIRRALVLCADHELNASGFTARCIASAGASLRAAVIGGSRR